MSLVSLAVSLRDVHAGPCLRGVSVAVPSGERLAVLGPNGSGKTTLLRTVAGLEPVRAGDRCVATPIGYVPQDYRESFLPWWSMRLNVLLGTDPRRTPAAIERRLRAVIDALGLPASLLGRTPRELSGGQLQRAAIARALLLEPRVLLLDEPFAALDEEGRAAARRTVLDVARREAITVLVATHDRDDVRHLTERAIEVRDPTDRAIDVRAHGVTAA